jgi:hypothetical protein
MNRLFRGIFIAAMAVASPVLSGAHAQESRDWTGFYVGAMPAPPLPDMMPEQ